MTSYGRLGMIALFHMPKKYGKGALDPILVTTDLDGCYQHDVLLALNGVLIKEKDWERFAKIYYFFFDDQDTKEKENARSMWKSFFFPQY